MTSTPVLKWFLDSDNRAFLLFLLLLGLGMDAKGNESQRMIDCTVSIPAVFGRLDLEKETKAFFFSILFFLVNVKRVDLLKPTIRPNP